MGDGPGLVALGTSLGEPGESLQWPIIGLCEFRLPSFTKRLSVEETVLPTATTGSDNTATAAGALTAADRI